MNVEINQSRVVSTIVAAVILAALAWGWNINERVAKIENPDSVAARLETLEQLMFPIAVEYEIRQRTAPPPPPDSVVGGIAPGIAMPPNAPINPIEARDAEDNIRSQIEQRPIEDARNRRGKPLEVKKK